MSKNAFTASNLSSQKRSIPRRRSKSWKMFLKIILTLVWIILIFFLSVWMISWFKWFFDNVKHAILSSVSKTIWTPMKRDQYNPHIDIQHKMQKIYDLFHFDYRGFIWMVDDNYAIKPFSLKDIMTIHYHQKSFTGVENLPASCWKHDKWKTRQLVDKEGFSNINYTTHYPCYFEFERLKQLWDKYNMMEESYVLEDIYFNSFKHPDPILDSTIRLGIWNKSIFERDFNAAINNPNIKFVCNSVEGWSKELEEALKLIILCEQK